MSFLRGRVAETVSGNCTGQEKKKKHVKSRVSKTSQIGGETNLTQSQFFKIHKARGSEPR